MSLETAHGLLRWGRRALWASLNPFEGAERARERLADLRPRLRRGPEIESPYDWQADLRALVTDSQPCRYEEGFVSAWSTSPRALAAQGVKVGRGTYWGWDDADPGLARATWGLVRYLRPRAVVETGVARGLTTSIVLQALALNGVGDLFSVDLPPSIARDRFTDQTAAAVPDGHDSLHSHRNMSFELAQAWRALRPGGFLLADDVHRNSAFVECVGRAHPAGALCRASDDGGGYSA